MNKALLVINPQNAYFMPESPFYVKNCIDVLNNINKLIIAFDEKGYLIIFIRHQYKRDGSDLDTASQTINDAGFIEGSQEVGFVDELQKSDDAHVVTKNRYDAFSSPELEKLLKSKQIKEVVIRGFMANYCVSSTARSAHTKDYHVTVASDGISTPALDDIGFGKQEWKKIVNVELTTIAYGIGHVKPASQICAEL